MSQNFGEPRELKRGLKRRHLNMIAIGGTIGTGLFLTSGYNIQSAGSLGGPLSYLFIGALVFILMRGLGEMSTFMPISGAYSTYSGLFVHPIFGFAVGWNVWVNCAISIGAEFVGGAVIMQNFFPDIPPVIWCVALGAFVLALNMINIKSYGEAEFWFASIKVVAIIIFIVVGTLMIFGIVGDQGVIGFSNWNSSSLLPFGFAAVFTVSSAVIWSYLGVETVAIAAGETENPEKNVPHAVKSIFFRILLFYVGSVTVMSLVVPFTDASVMNNGFAAVFELAGFKAAYVVMNLVILTSLTSCANANVYLASRIMLANAQEGRAPKIFKSINSRGIPVPAVLITMLIASLSLACFYISPDKVFIWLVSIAGFNTFLSWLGILLSHVMFRKWLIKKGGIVKNLKFRTGTYPIPSMLAIAFLVTIMVMVAINPATRFSFYIGLPMMVAYFIGGLVLYKKGKLLPPDYQPYLDANINDTVVHGESNLK